MQSSSERIAGLHLRNTLETFSLCHDIKRRLSYGKLENGRAARSGHELSEQIKQRERAGCISENLIFLYCR